MTDDLQKILNKHKKFNDKVPEKSIVDILNVAPKFKKKYLKYKSKYLQLKTINKI